MFADRTDLWKLLQLLLVRLVRMGKAKAEFGTPKWISNNMRSKGLQKLRWYCQMCQKQCRDANGFKCHIGEEHNSLKNTYESVQAVNPTKGSSSSLVTTLGNTSRSTVGLLLRISTTF